MAEKSPRRPAIPDFSAEKLDYKESLARTDNKRANNRLRLRKGYIRGQENTNLSSMNYEMRMLKHELRGIKQNSGYFVVDGDGKGARRSERRETRKRHVVAKSRSQEGNSKHTAQENGLLNLPDITLRNTNLAVINNTEPLSVVPDDKQTKDAKELKNKCLIQNNASIVKTAESKQRAASPVGISISPAQSLDRENIFEESSLRPESREISKSESCLVTDLEAARDRIQNRLAGKHMSKDDGDITPYMHVPPDGLPRTVYLLPPMEDLLEEAKKARYVRKLRRRCKELGEDDPERELDIHEIFSKDKS
ncbi:uncharacterized protein LOC116615068 [Nematostella vectensis]|uniref:uncharacterized protein LOC116615068 n=1 Tax=Nematostella vectensis TaxID=45351 RepID=UPI00138FE297|nr:uncharacterized protein LOC116615068 [Nematostella vectensis]